MKDSKALRAAHVLKKYCKQKRSMSSCDEECIFRITKGYCELRFLDKPPEEWYLRDVDRFTYKQEKEETPCYSNFTCEQCDNFSTNGTLASCESNDVSAEDFYESRLKRRACKNFVHRTRGVE